MAAPSGPQAVIAAGGSAGLFTARTLGRAPVQVSDRARHHLFAPQRAGCHRGTRPPLRTVARGHPASQKESRS